MAYKKIKVTAAPKRKRRSISAFELTNEWRAMKADIDKGLAPDEALSAYLTDDDQVNYNIKSRRTVARFIQKYLAAHKRPYIVKSFTRDNNLHFLVHHVRVKKH